MITWWIWAAAIALIFGFRAWYDNWNGKLTAPEIDRYMTKAATAGAGEANDLATIRGFLEQDDGKEFFMVNLVRYTPGEVAHPTTGAPTTGQALTQAYTKEFLPALLRRGGHPAFATHKIGGYIDSWNTPPDPGWNIAGIMRYRSRRDLIELATNPRFKAYHAFKIAGVAETFSFPSQPILRTYLTPRVYVPLVITLAAAVVQIVVLLGEVGVAE